MSPAYTNPTSATDQPFDVAVVGAGVFGAWTAFQLSRAGANVILIDAYGPGNEFGVLSSEFGVLSLSSDSELRTPNSELLLTSDF